MMVPREQWGMGGHFVVFMGDGGGVHFFASGAVVCVSSTVLDSSLTGEM